MLTDYELAEIAVAGDAVVGKPVGDIDELNRKWLSTNGMVILSSPMMEWIRAIHAAWPALRDENRDLRNEVASVLAMLDELAELWGDEGKFRTCRDRLRKLIPSLRLGASKCRRCTGCQNSSHHWIDNPRFGECEDDEDIGPSNLCAHCDAIGDQCELCGGDGIPFDEDGEQTSGGDCCPACKGEGVIARGRDDSDG